MEKITIAEFKDIMHNGMIENFKTYGGITPVLFFLKDGEPNIMEIPTEYLGSYEGKSLLAHVIKNICTQPNVLAAGLIIEAYGAAIDANDESKKEIISGEKKISELNEKQDIIVMIFSTPENEELIAYAVDEEEKQVLNRFGENTDGSYDGGLSGMFSGFFNWGKN